MRVKEKLLITTIMFSTLLENFSAILIKFEIVVCKLFRRFGKGLMCLLPDAILEIQAKLLQTLLAGACVQNESVRGACVVERTSGYTMLVYLVREFRSFFSSTGRKPASYCHGVVSVVRRSVRPCMRACIRKLFSKNFSKTIDWIFTKFHRNIP